jgi:hypothetical protein
MTTPTDQRMSGKALHVSGHAIERALERIDPRMSWEQAKALLSAPAIARAAAFGAPYVRLGTGQRVVLDGFNVVTVLPIDTPSWRLGCPKEKH